MSKDSPITRETIDSMTDEHCEAVLEGLRERRMRALREYETMLALKRATLIAKHRAQFEQHIRMFNKENAAAEKAITKLQVRALKITALREQIESILLEDELEQESRKGEEADDDGDE